MKRSFALLLSILFIYQLLNAQLVRSVAGYIPFQNIEGWENKSSIGYFKSSTCEQSYYKIKLTGFDIGVQRDKKWWNSYSPFLLINIQTSDREFVTFIPTDKLHKVGVKEDFSIRSISNENLIGAFPYDGSDIKISINLYAFKTKDNLEMVLDVLENFQELFSNKLMQFVDVSKKIKLGIEQIKPRCQEVISFQDTWNPSQDNGVENPNTFKEGYFIVHPEDQELNYNFLRVKSLSQIKIIKDNKEEFLFSQNLDHVVIQFELFTSRKDRKTFPFHKKYSEALNYATLGRLEDCKTSYKESMDLLYLNDNFTLYDKYLTDLELSSHIEKQCKQVDDKFKLERNLFDPCSNKPIDDNNKVLELTKTIYRRKMVEKGLVKNNSNITLTEILEFEKSLSQRELEDLRVELENFSIEQKASAKIFKIRSSNCENKFIAEEFLEENKSQLKLIHFIADWCLPCKWFRINTIGPLKDIYDHSQLAIFEIDIDSALGKKLAEHYKIFALPRIMMINSNNCVIHEASKAYSLEEIQLILDSFK